MLKHEEWNNVWEKELGLCGCGRPEKARQLAQKRGQSFNAFYAKAIEQAVSVRDK